MLLLFIDNVILYWKDLRKLEQKTWAENSQTWQIYHKISNKNNKHTNKELLYGPVIIWGGEQKIKISTIFKTIMNRDFIKIRVP